MELVSYDEQTIGSRNPLARFSHGRRMSIAQDLVRQHVNIGTARVLDFGSGPGEFLKSIYAAGALGTGLFGYDPYYDAGEVPYTVLNSLSELEPGSMDVVTALETLEHMLPEEREQ